MTEERDGARDDAVSRSLGGEEGPMPLCTPWVRARLAIPDVERYLSPPQGARIDEDFDVLRVRVEKAVDRIAETTRAVAEEIQARGRFLNAMSLVSAAIGIGAFFTAAAMPEWRLPAILVAAAELAAVLVLRGLQKRLARDAISLNDVEVRFREPLDAAKTPEDLRRLGERIRKEMAETLGKGERNA